MDEELCGGGCLLPLWMSAPSLPEPVGGEAGWGGRKWQPGSVSPGAAVAFFEEESPSAGPGLSESGGEHAALHGSGKDLKQLLALH